MLTPRVCTKMLKLAQKQGGRLSNQVDKSVFKTEYHGGGRLQQNATIIPELRSILWASRQNESQAEIGDPKRPSKQTFVLLGRSSPLCEWSPLVMFVYQDGLRRNIKTPHSNSPYLLAPVWGRHSRTYDCCKPHEKKTHTLTGGSDSPVSTPSCETKSTDLKAKTVTTMECVSSQNR